MKKIILLIIGLLTLWFSGCIPEKAVGVYDSPNGQFVVVKKDGSLSWSPASKTEDELVPVGIMEINKENKEFILLCRLLIRCWGQQYRSRLIFKN